MSPLLAALAQKLSAGAPPVPARGIMGNPYLGTGTGVSGASDYANHPAPSSSGVGSEIGSLWHHILGGITDVASLPSNFIDEMAKKGSERQYEYDTHPTSGLTKFTNIFGDIGSSANKGWNDSFGDGEKHFGSNLIQDVADRTKAHLEASKTGNLETENPDKIKPGYAKVNGKLKFVGGLGFDVLSDPLNAVGFGTAARGASAAEKALTGAQDIKAAEKAIAATPVGGRQLTIKALGQELKTGIPAPQIGARLAAAGSPVAQSLVDKFRPLQNHLNNPELKAGVTSARHAADALHYQYMHEHLAPIFSKLSLQEQRDLLQQAVKHDHNADPLVETARKEIIDLAKEMKNTKLHSDLHNYYLPKSMHLKFNGADNVYSHVAELIRQGSEHKEGITHFLGRHHEAMQKALEHQRIFDELPIRALPRGKGAAVTAARKKLESEGYVTHTSPALAGRMIHESIVPQVNRAEDFLRMRGATKFNAFTRFLDGANSTMKQVDVGLNPASTARRVLGFANQQVLNGHLSLPAFKKAVAINARHHVLYRDLRTGNLMAKGAGASMRLGKRHLSSNELYAQAAKRGVFGNFTRSEVRNLGDVEGARTAVGKKIINAKQKTGVNKALETSFNINEKVDNNFRLATFLHAVEQEFKRNPKKSFDEIFDHAANEVKRTHLEFSGLTPFERNTMTRLMPFYAAISRSTPIAYRQLVANPGGAAVLPLIQRDIGNSFNNENAGPIPSYLTGEGGVLSGFYQGNPVVLNQKNDITDAYQQFMGANPLKGVLGAITPGLKDPVELALNKNVFTGAPTREKPSDLLNYFAQQTPFTAIANRKYKESQGGTPTGANANRNDWVIDPTLLRLLGIGTNVVTPKQQEAAKKAHNKKHPWMDLFSP